MANTSMNIRMDSEVKKQAEALQTLEAIKKGEEIIKEGKARFNNADEMFADLGI